ncbi:MAG: DUF5317 family protein [Acidimicrobiales bacterium]
MAFTFIAVLAGLAVGLARGGSFRNLAERDFSAWPALAAGIGCQVAARYVAGWEGFALLAGSYGLLALFAAANLGLTGMGVVLLGIMLNFTAIAVNHGMPVAPRAVVAAGIATPSQLPGLEHRVHGKHVIAGASTRLIAIGDVIPFAPLHSVFSFGDLIMAAGVADVMARLVSAPNRHERARSHPAAASAPPEHPAASLPGTASLGRRTKKAKGAHAGDSPTDSSSGSKASRGDAGFGAELLE